MATFLATRKMHPALAARVEASVRGKGRGQRTLAPRAVALVRAAIVVMVVIAVAWVVARRRQDKSDFERDRAAVLDAARSRGAPLSPRDAAALDTAEAWMVKLARPYEGDVTAPEIRAPRALADRVKRPAVYAHGTVEAFAKREDVRRAAAASNKDAFLLCLVDPPASRAEKVVLAKVRTAYFNAGALEDRTASVRRLYEEELGFQVLVPAWIERVRAAVDVHELTALRRELERAPVERARDAARAEVLIAVLDEPSTGTGPTDIDGERAHDVRVAIVDLAAGKVLLRARKHVDPSAWSTGAREEYSSGLDGCALALDVLDAAAR